MPPLGTVARVAMGSRRMASRRERASSTLPAARQALTGHARNVEVEKKMRQEKTEKYESQLTVNNGLDKRTTEVRLQLGGGIRQKEEVISDREGDTTISKVIGQRCCDQFKGNCEYWPATPFNLRQSTANIQQCNTAVVDNLSLKDANFVSSHTRMD